MPNDSMTDDNIYFASIYRLTGVNFWESAKVLSTTLETNSAGMPTSLKAIPFYFLVSHSIELFLKSALLKRGFQESELKKYNYGHKLDALLAELQNKGVSVSPVAVSVINGLHNQHQKHALRYSALVDDGEKTYMPPPPLVFLCLKNCCY